jgi:hypothetical protein
VLYILFLRGIILRLITRAITWDLAGGGDDDAHASNEIRMLVQYLVDRRRRCGRFGRFQQSQPLLPPSNPSSVLAWRSSTQCFSLACSLSRPW